MEMLMFWHILKSLLKCLIVYQRLSVMDVLIVFA